MSLGKERPAFAFEHRAAASSVFRKLHFSSLLCILPRSMNRFFGGYFFQAWGVKMIILFCYVYGGFSHFGMLTCFLKKKTLFNIYLLFSA